MDICGWMMYYQSFIIQLSLLDPVYTMEPLLCDPPLHDNARCTTFFLPEKTNHFQLALNDNLCCTMFLVGPLSVVK